MDRTTRYEDLLPIQQLTSIEVTIIGVGAIGRQVAIMLASMGVCSLSLYDPDIVSEENLGPQGYAPIEIGNPKVEALTQELKRLNPDISVNQYSEKYSPRKHHINRITFCCVDSITDRKYIGQGILKEGGFFIDGRMAAEYCEIHTPHTPEEYAKTIFPQEEAYQASCSSKSTIYCASIAAGLMVAQYAKWLRSMEIDPFISLNILASHIDLGVTHLIPKWSPGQENEMINYEGSNHHTRTS